MSVCVLRKETLGSNPEIYIYLAVFADENHFKIYIPDSCLSRLSLGVYTGLHAWTARWQVEHQQN